MRDELSSFLGGNKITDKPVWLTETGSTADPSLTIRTNYPNSPKSQAADVFRRMVQAYGHGDSLAIWHTYISSSSTGADNDWRLYGVRTDTAQAQPSYYSFKLLTEELIPFRSVDMLFSEPRGANVYKITKTSGEVRYVAWGSGSYTLPPGITKMTSVIPDKDGNFAWHEVEASTQIALSPDPGLLR